MEYQIKRLGCFHEDFYEYADFLSAPYTLSSRFTSVKKVTPQYLQWQYSENPAGNAIAYGAYYKGEMVSHFATVPVMYYINGKLSKCLLALNLVTHPEHRGKGLFVKIASATLEDVYNLGYEYVFGVANQNSTFGLINKLGFKLISSLDVKIGIGEVILDEANEYFVKPDRSEAFLNWRLSNPSSIYIRSRNGCINSPTGKFGIYAQLKNPSFNDSAILKLKKKYVPLKVWIGLCKIKITKGIFIDLPENLRPVPLNLIYFNIKGHTNSLEKKDVFFELIDFDAY